MTALIWAASLVATCAHAGDAKAPEALSLTGERWRLELRRDKGTFDFLVQPQGEAGFVSVLRPGGELPWYGYNVPGGSEAQTCDTKPTVQAADAKGPVTVHCALSKEAKVAHEAAYYPVPDGVLVVTRFSSPMPAPYGSIVRSAPKLDVDTSLLTHYAFVDATGRQHQGAIAALGERDAYAGAGGWGPRGDVVSDLDPEHPYMLLYNPERAVSLGIVLAFYRTSWRGTETFLQLYRGGYNFWYTGFAPRHELRGERVFILYARQSGSPEAIHEDTPRLCQEAKQLVSGGAVEAPETRAVLAASERFQGEWQAVCEEVSQQPPTRAAWLATEMLRAAREWADRDPVKAVDLVERARAELAPR